MKRKLKNKKLNNKKIFGLTSLILAGGMVTSCTTANREFEYIRTEYSSDGYYLESRQFGQFDAPVNTFNYYDEWVLGEDGKYSRNVKEYNANGLTQEDIRILVEDKDAQFDDMLGVPIKEYRQISDTIEEEDINRGAHFEATIYDMNVNKYVDIDDGKHITLVGTIIEVSVLSGGIGALIAWNKHEEKNSKKLTLEKREK